MSIGEKTRKRVREESARQDSMSLSVWLSTFAGNDVGESWHARMMEASRIVADYESRSSHDGKIPNAIPKVQHP